LEEEALEDLAGLLGQGGQGVVDDDGLVDAREALPVSVGRLVAGAVGVGDLALGGT
jgi:hypothetical protein